jgi:D-alanine-D-alanine ligase
MRIGVLRGGVGHEYDVSLKTGATVLKHLPSHHQRHDILITKDGVWHYNGVPIKPGQLVRKLDLVFNALHGEFGEDGQVQRLLEDVGLPYTGPKHFGASLAMNKIWAKDLFERSGLNTPLSTFIKKGEDVSAQAVKIFKQIPPPWIIKPADKGSSVGLYLAKNIDELHDFILDCLNYSNIVMVEEFIKGKEGTCGVVDNFRGQDSYALMPVEIRHPHNRLFDYELKYGGQADELCPGTFSKEETRQIEDAARVAHQVLGLRHYSRSDFIVGRGKVYILETNSLPGLTEESLLPRSLNAIGCKMDHFLGHVVDLATRR